jgi:hypothetical protein
MGKKPGRPPRPHEPIEVYLTLTPKLGAYLDDLIDEEGYGNSRPDVLRQLAWHAIRDLIGQGALDRRRGPSDTGEEAGYNPPEKEGGSPDGTA